MLRSGATLALNTNRIVNSISIANIPAVIEVGAKFVFVVLGLSDQEKPTTLIWFHR